MVDTELLDAQADRRCVAAGDNRSLNAAVLQHFQTMPVQRVERFDFLAVVADENPPVGQHAVHIHNQQPDFGGACLQFGRKGLHYDSFRRPKKVILALNVPAVRRYLDLAINRFYNYSHYDLIFKPPHRNHERKH